MTLASPTAPGGSASADERRALADAFDRPTKRDEAWRHAPHRDLDRLSFGPAAPAPTDGSVVIDDRVPELDGPRIVIVNGTVDFALSRLDDVPDGVAVTALAAAASERPQDVAAHISTGIDKATDAFVAYNAAYGDDGAFISIADGIACDRPVHIVEVSAPASDPNMSCAGVVIRVGESSSVTVVSTHIGVGDTIGGSSVRTTIELANAATLDHIVLQDVPAAQTHLGQIEVHQAETSHYRSRAFNLGGSYGRLAYWVLLDGAGARADLSGLYVGGDNQTLDQQIMVIHRAPDCTSRQVFRGVLDDASTGVFRGGIDVRPGADGTDATQANDNLLLSDRAEVDTQPRLEILADEVACQHGATVGQLDDSALYYLRSRGIPADEARRLLIRGFAGRAVDEVESPSVRTWINTRLGHDDE